MKSSRVEMEELENVLVKRLCAVISSWSEFKHSRYFFRDDNFSKTLHAITSYSNTSDVLITAGIPFSAKTVALSKDIRKICNSSARYSLVDCTTRIKFLTQIDAMLKEKYSTSLLVTELLS